MRKALLPLLALLLLCTLLATPADAARKVKTTGHDAVTTAGQPVTLSAKFERDMFGYLAPDIRNDIDRRFTVIRRPAQQKVGVAITGRIASPTAEHKHSIIRIGGRFIVRYESITEANL